MPIRLDQRLSLIASLTDYGSVADVGCDHGKLGYYLVSTDRASKVIATDISAPSLAKASDLARENGVSDVVETRLGDGLAPIKDGEVDTVIIAGLGGDVISEILARSRAEDKKFGCFILSPNTHPEKVRREIVKQGHKIVFDDMIECGTKVYTVIKSVTGECSLDEMQITFGAFYGTSRNFVKFANRELNILQDILQNNPQSSKLAKRIDCLKSALDNAKHTF